MGERQPDPGYFESDPAQPENNATERYGEPLYYGATVLGNLTETIHDRPFSGNAHPNYFLADKK